MAGERTYQKHGGQRISENEEEGNSSDSSGNGKGKVKEMEMKKRLPANRIICGDALKVLKTFPPESIDMVMTSPPYSL
jgi:hypothetical protein